MSVISTNKLCRSYGERRGVRDVNLTLAKGEILGFLGPNGAGKSTTIRMLLGFLAPSSGSATVLGMDCWSKSPMIRKDVGYVAGDVRLYPWLTARRAFQLVGEIRGMALESPGHELAERFRLEVNLPVRKMSRGNRQKLALIMALVHQPALVILDEPTSGLDPLMQDTLASCLRELASAGHSVFFSSHTLSEVETLCDRVAVVRDGIIVADDRLSSLQAVAPRRVSVVFESASAASSCQRPDWLNLEGQDGRTCYFSLQGDAVELTRWAADQPITDISIGRPNLETLFRSWYESESSDTEGGAS